MPRTSTLIALEGVPNFRDLGGVICGDAAIRSGALYRSAHHGDATDADVARIAQMGLKLYADLRRPIERERHPTRRPDRCSADLVANSQARPGDEAPHMSYLLSPEANEQWLGDRLTEFYAFYPFDPGLKEVARATFAALAAGKTPVVIHCHAGKDRTGYLVALIMALLGADEEMIFAEYLFTNEVYPGEARVDEIMAAFMKAVGKTPDRDHIRFMLAADARYLRSAFDSLHQKHGSVECYLAEELGVSVAAQAQVRNALLARQGSTINSI